MSAIFVVVTVAQIGVTSFFLLFPGRVDVRTFLSFAECCSRVMFFPFGLEEHVSTHTLHISEYIQRLVQSSQSAIGNLLLVNKTTWPCGHAYQLRDHQHPMIGQMLSHDFKKLPNKAPSTKLSFCIFLFEN